MVSIDHFRQELLGQLRRAATEGRIDILINSGELCRTIPGSCSWSASCCDAMQEELKSGDVLVLDRTNGAGMTVRYILPRDLTGHPIGPKSSDESRSLSKSEGLVSPLDRLRQSSSANLLQTNDELLCRQHALLPHAALATFSGLACSMARM
jgi:hypothetical protein